MKTIYLQLLLAVALQAQSNFGQGPITPTVATATVSGAVKSSANLAALSGATITALRTSPQFPLYRVQAQSAANGTFQITGMPAGTYALCVDATKDIHLDPCAWSGTPATVTVADGQNVTGVSLSLIKGSTLQVNINDPGQFLQIRPGEIGPPHVLVAVMPQKGPPVPLGMVSATATGQQYQVVIPGNTAYTLLVYSKEVYLTDSSQKAVPATGGTATVTVPSSAASPVPVVYQVTGRTGN
jgi:hypothetical protein